MKVKDTGTGIQIHDFTAAEAYRIASRLEREGIRFYQMLREKASDPQARQVITFLLNSESEHLRIFEQLLEGEAGDSSPDEGNDLLESVDNEVFALPGREAFAADFDRALELGIIIEKRSLAFYLEVVKHTESPEGKNALRRIIEEEKQHWEELKKLAG